MLPVLLLLTLSVVGVVPEKAVSSHKVRQNANDCLRLPTYAYPFAYQLELQPSFDSETFEATAYVGVRTDMFGWPKDISQFVLHAEDLNIKYSNVYIPTTGEESLEEMIKNEQNNQEQESRIHVHDKDTDSLTLEVGKELEHAWSYLLTFKYSGKIRDDVVGFYKSSYAKDSEKRSVFATQFQPTHARKAFPCFDEPLFKANFTIIISIPPGYSEYNALSNMPIKETSIRDDGGRDIIFYPSLPMSSYLVAWVISDFSSMNDDGNGKEVKIRNWARADSLNWAQYSLKVTRPALEALENYTGIPYIYPYHEPHVLDKIDQVAIPEFKSGAMENWGLITYRDTALLYNDGAASALQTVLAIISHELSHMWFGNLVTTAQWDHTWLNEGFAEFLEMYLAGAEVEPDWHPRLTFIVNELQAAFALDSVKTSRPLTRRVCSAREASDAFELLTYHKGASILRMINYVLGPENFKKAIRAYLNKYSFQSVSPNELFIELKTYASAVGLTQMGMEEFLRCWTEQNGYPFILVSREYASNSARIYQRPYLFMVDIQWFPLYYIPLTWTEKGESFDIKRPQRYMSTEESIITINEMPDDQTWVIFNIQQTGYYRVMYDYTNYGLLIEHLVNEANHLDTIHVINRAQLIDDAFAFGRSSQLRYKTVFDLLDYLRREKEYIPWASAFSGFSFIARMLVNNKEYPLFQKYVLNLISRLYTSFNFQIPSAHNEKLLFNSVSTWACAMGHKHCITEAVTALHNYLDDNTAVQSDLRSIVYCYGIKNSEDENWEKLWEKYIKSPDETEKKLILKGLSCSRSEHRLEELLQYSINAEYIRKQDGSFVFSAVYSNPLGVEVALNFLEANFEEILSHYGSLGAISNIVTGIADYLTTEPQYLKFDNFVSSRKEELGDTGDAAVQTVLLNTIWVEYIASSLLEALEEKSLYRLPTSVAPEQYTLFLDPSLEDDSFIGTVNIIVSVKEATRDILLHSQDLSIRSDDVTVVCGSESSYSYNLNSKIYPTEVFADKIITGINTTRESGNKATINILSANKTKTVESSIRFHDRHKSNEDIKKNMFYNTIFRRHIDESTKEDNLKYTAESNLLENMEIKPDYDIIKLTLREELIPGSVCCITINYSGDLRDDMVGFYRSYYEDNQGRQRKFAATKFAPTHARKAFPCFDEPSFKARFKVHLKIPASHPQYRCLANAEEEHTTILEDGSKQIIFMNTPKMSTYIVAWVVSDLEDTSDSLSEPIRFTTWARRNARDWSAYSLEVSRSMLEHLVDYTGYPYTDESDEYPLRKVDQVATPDFVSGAMENWGLITYRETALLYNDGNAAAKKRVASVIAHELAHMWFGNLVTTHWWESTWLNEGFANYFQHLITDRVEVMWQIMDQYVIDHVQFALQLDGEPTAKPITHNVVTPTDAVASFASLTYSKGGSILRMLSFILGEKNFQNALQEYIKNNAYKSATPHDLFVEFLPYASDAGLTPDELTELLISWTEQPGYPLVHVKRHYDGSGDVTISQERFLSRAGDEAIHQYSIPLSWVAEDGIYDTPKLEGYLLKDEKSKTLTGFQENGWLTFNTQQIGYFRISYDTENWERLVTYLSGPRFHAIHWLNRAQLLDDAFELARARRLPFEHLFALTDYLHQENDYTPWAAALAGFARLDRLLAARADYEHFQNYVLHLIGDIYYYMGFAERFYHTERLLVAAITSRACAVGITDCHERAATLLQSHLYQGAKVASDVRAAVYCHGVRYSASMKPPMDQRDVWEKLWNQFSDTQDEAERALILNGLGCTSNTENLQEFLKRTVEGGSVRKQEGASAFAAVYASPTGADIVLEFLHEHMSATKEFLGSVTSIISGLANRLITNEQREKLADLVGKYDLGSSGEAALQNVDRNLEWINLYAEEFMEVLNAHFELTTSTSTEKPTETSTEKPTEATSEITTEEPPEITTPSGQATLYLKTSSILILFAGLVIVQL